MFVWQKRASADWLAANETALREIAGERLAIISRPANQNVVLEIATANRRELEKIRRRFGGAIEKLSRDWLKRFLHSQKSKPLKIGRRLVIFSSSMSRSRSTRLLIPAGAAFGTGGHATTAMSL